MAQIPCVDDHQSEVDEEEEGGGGGAGIVFAGGDVVVSVGAMAARTNTRRVSQRRVLGRKLLRRDIIVPKSFWSGLATAPQQIMSWRNRMRVGMKRGC